MLYHTMDSKYHTMDSKYHTMDSKYHTMITEVFIKVVESVLTADKFQLPSPAATTTKETAVAVIQWSKEEAHMEKLTALLK